MKPTYVAPNVPLQNTYVTLRVKDCEPSQIQPPKRIDPKEIKNLETIVRKTKQIMPIEVVPNPAFGLEKTAKPFIIANGTRRWKVAMLLGYEYVDAVVIPNQSPNIAWLDRNSGARPITGTELFYAWAECETSRERADALQAISSANIREQIDLFIRIVGEDTARFYGKQQKFSPSMAKQAVRFAHLSENTMVSKKAVTAYWTLLWMLNHQTKRLVDDILRHENTNATIIRQAVEYIRANQPCQWGMTAGGAKTLKDRPVVSTVAATRMLDTPVPSVTAKKLADVFTLGQ